MRPKAQIGQPAQRSRWVPSIVFGLALVVLGGTLIWAALDLRSRIRLQIVQRDAEILEAVTLLQHMSDQGSDQMIASLDDPGEQFDLAMKVSRLRNVLGVRLYSPRGKIVNAFPVYITEAAMPDSDLDQLKQLKPLSYFSSNARMEEHVLGNDTNAATAALLFVDVPLPTEEKHLAGVIQFIMDGSSVARQFAELDRNLALKFSAAFVVSAAILIAGLGLALRQVQRANEQLAEHTQNLLQANRELALAARTSAVGAVASHLIHGLRNPLSGLRNFVRAHNTEVGSNSDTDWQMAVNTTQRMEELINRVVRVLQEQQSAVEYEISISELIGMLAQKAKPLADSAGVRFETHVPLDRFLSNREADLILLILENLVQNAIEATPSGKAVELRVSGEDGATNFEVRDQGHGLAPAAKARLFAPCTSAKKGGAGIGLAISKQLAQSLGAKLEIIDSSASGCAFQLSVPEPSSNAVQRSTDGRVLTVGQAS